MGQGQNLLRFSETLTDTSMSVEPRNNLKDAFRNFLEKAENDAWIAGYKWFSADTFAHLRQKMGGPKTAANISRTHKRSTDGLWWAVEVEAFDGTQVGVDLEAYISRPLLNEPAWITERLGISKSTTPQKILEEWSCREAAFKALAPQNAGVLMSHFKRSATNTFAVRGPGGDRSVQVRSAWSGRWVLSLAWRSLS